MSDIFLSYASPDRPFAEKLSHALEQQELSVWWDRTIPPGKTFDEVIEAALNEARSVIVIWSKTAVASQWVRAEAGDAMNRGIMIPILHEEVTLPLVFRQIQAAQLSDWKGEVDHPGFQQVLQAIRGVIGQSVKSGAVNTQQTVTEIPVETEGQQRDSSLPGARKSKSQIQSATKYVSYGKWLAMPVFLLATVILLFNYLPLGENYIENKQTLQGAASDGVVFSGDKKAVEKQNKVKKTTKPESEIQTLSNAHKAPVTISETVEPAKVKPIPVPVKNAKSETLEAASILKPETNNQLKLKRALTDLQSKPKTSVHTNAQKNYTNEQAPVAVANVVEPVGKKTLESTAQQVITTMKIVIAVYGMPNDEGLANSATVKAYSRNISNLMAEIIESSLSAKVSFIHHFPDSGERNSLSYGAKRNKANKKLCQEKNADLVLFSLIEEIYIGPSMGFAWSREPFFASYDCKTGVREYRKYVAKEVKNEAFPYADELARSFRTFTKNTQFSKYQ
jgi:hypothetical protein